MATRVYFGKAVSGNDYRNNGATVTAGGTVPDGQPVTNVPTAAQVLGFSGRRAPVVASGDYTGAGWARYPESADFATMTAGQYVIRRNCSQLAGESNTLLQSGGNAAGAHHSIHFRTTRQTVMIDSWDYATGTPTYNATNPSGCDFGDDDAATPSLSVPGELCYMVTGTTATTDEYAPRTHG